MARKSASNDTNNKRIPERSNSFALFDDDDVVAVANNSDDIVRKTKKESKKRDSAKHPGSQTTDEKPDTSKSAVKETIQHSHRGFRSIKVNQVVADAKGDSVDNKGTDSTISDKGTGNSEEKLQGSGRTVKRTNDKVKRGKRKVQEAEGGDSVSKRKSSSGETLAKQMSAYKLREFDVTDKVNNYSIDLGPKETDRWDLVEVVIDGFRYRVSPWSIRDKQYIQGLDSHFLVSKYKVGKR